MANAITWVENLNCDKVQCLYRSSLLYVLYNTGLKLLGGSLESTMQIFEVKWKVNR